VTGDRATRVSADDRRVHDALRRCMIARIATVSAEMEPLIMPLYFVAVEGRVYMNNSTTSPTVRNVEAHPRVLVLLTGRQGELIEMRGTARYVRDEATMRRVVRAALPKYVLRPRALWSWIRHLSRLPMRSRYVRERSSGSIEITPESYAIASA
jgi:nitroimidazol reductase NimA-like FMN-containing flavoprotein (pyridoxamine 5'-phosphate oxidase superfamily)